MKSVLITGATSGIGRAAAISLANKGHNLIVVCRNRDKMNKLISDLQEINTNITVDGFIADFSSFSSIKESVSTIYNSKKSIDVLINNAGVFNLKRHESEDGYELTLAVNYLGHFLFTNLLLPLLNKGDEPRIINVGSDSHYFAKLDLDDLSFNKRKYSGFKAYSQSRLATMFFTQELAEILKDEKISVNCVHPGHVNTNIWNFGDNATVVQKIAAKLQQSTSISPEQGAETVVYLAISSEVESVSGKYFANKKIKKPSRKCQNKELQKQLWLESCKITDIDC